jgi:hypothetical protein
MVMKKNLRIMLLALCLASLTTLLAAQSTEGGNSGASAGSSTSDTGKSRGSSDKGQEEIQDPPGEPKGSNVTGTEREDDSTVVASDTATTEGKKPSVEGESSGDHSQK